MQPETEFIHSLKPTKLPVRLMTMSCESSDALQRGKFHELLLLDLLLALVERGMQYDRHHRRACKETQ